MKYIKLGKTDIEVSKICLGCMGFGDDSMYKWSLGPKDTKEIVAYAYDKGINFFDTANQYSNGTSEEYLGKAIKVLGIRREDVIIASKVFFNEGGLSKEAIKREIDQSLLRLGTDYLDLYLIHRFDYNVPIEETMDALNDLVKSGKVRSLGSSSILAYQMLMYQNLAKEKGYARFEVMENHYNLLYREEEREMIPLCKELDVSLIPYSPLAAGHLTRINWDSDSIRSLSDDVAKRRYGASEDVDKLIVERVAELAKKRNIKMSEVALSWLYKKGVASPIIGASKTKYIDDAINALNVELSDEEVSYLEELYVPHPLKGPIIKKN